MSQALAPLKKRKTFTWLLDRGFDDIAAWRTIWEQEEHVVCRIYHTERTVTFQNRDGHWVQGSIEQAKQYLRPLARVETTLEVKRGKQVRPKKQPVQVELMACSVRLTYSTGVRRPGKGKWVTKQVWLVQATILGTDCQPWLLLTDWPVQDEQSAMRIFAHVSPTLERGGQLQVYERVPRLGRGPSPRLASRSHLGGFGLGRSRVSL